MSILDFDDLIQNFIDDNEDDFKTFLYEEYASIKVMDQWIRANKDREQRFLLYVDEARSDYRDAFTGALAHLLEEDRE